MSLKRRLARTNQFTINRIIASTMLAVGALLLAISVFHPLPFSAAVGLGLAFWGAILLYITPSKHVNLEILNASTHSALANIEKLIADSKLKGKAIYLPPKYLGDYESSLVFVPRENTHVLPTHEKVNDNQMYSKDPEGVWLVPPGLALSKLLEKTLGTSFTRTDLNFLQHRLPKLLVEDTEIAEKARVENQTNRVTVEITNDIFNQVCQETGRLQKTHEQVGCLLSSTIACALAKAAGKPVIIEKEERSLDERTMRIQYLLLEG